MTWLTPYSGFPKDEARAFAAQMPTVSEPTSPGPAATATASTSDRPAPASDRALRSAGRKDSKCARDAISGMMPP